MKDIKEKEIIRSIHSIDKKEILNHSVHKKDINEKKIGQTSREEQKQQIDVKHDPIRIARDKVVHYEKVTSFETIHRAKRIMKYGKNKKKELQRRNDISQKNVQIKEKELDIPKEGREEKNGNHSILDGNDMKKINNENKSMDERKIKTRVQNQRKTSLDNKSSIKNNSKSYQNRMKRFSINKHKNQIKEAKEKTTLLQKAKTTITKGAVNTFKVLRKTVTSIKNIVSFGTGLLLLIVITLFIGVFSALPDDSRVNTALSPVSEDVLKYTETIHKYAKKYDIEEYSNLIIAVMMQESGGKGNDPMQASECGYNEKYPKKKDGITDPEYSIEVGVHNLSDCTKKAKVNNTTDIEHISLALQGYNYGQAYIAWAVTNFGGYTRANAKVYSDEMRAKLQVNVYGDPKYVSHVLQYYHLGNGNIVEVAKSQIGNVGGKPYWSWYGFNNRVEWCACFVSWCANEAGLIDKGLVPKFAYCPSGIDWFKEHKQWQPRTITPQPGYIIFFDWEQDGISDHVGIVEKIENDVIYTIEGNSLNDECRIRNYRINDKIIFGYGNFE